MDMGLQLPDIEDCCMDTHALVNGQKELKLPKFGTVVISINSGKSQAFKKDKKNLLPLETKELKKIDKTASDLLTVELKSIQSTLKACTRRLESVWCSNNSWMWEDLQKYWFNHPIASTLAKNLIWRIQNGKNIRDGLWHNQGLADVKGKPLGKIPPKAKVTLWHPAYSPDSVDSWRKHILEFQIRQPIRQAFREIYLATDAERKTVDTSARFAGNILKQNQFAALCRELGWDISLVGPFDSYSNAEKTIKPFDLTIGWGGDPVGDECNGVFYSYITMKDVTFSKQINEIPPIVFSEILRDLDLFVSVASIGVDPNWNSRQSNPLMADYWSKFTNADITESGRLRRESLELLIPLLPCGKKLSIGKKHLDVTGVLRNYQIHLQSGAVFRQPDNKHICIVPKSDNDEKSLAILVGDPMLSLIVSKALILANDDQIKDKSILSQIR